jgi:uncharacterized protein YegJ (DUF2314 family)
MYKLLNVVERKSKSFWVPSEKDLRAIKKGDHVKVIFDPGERMWVKITKVNQDDFEGVLDNVPAVVQSVKLGHPITLKSHHICDLRPNP